MDYDKMYKEAKAAGNLHHMAPRQIKFKKGDVVVGKFLGREELKSKDPKMPDYYVYMFERNDETVRFPISGAYDRADGASLKEGGVYALEYLEMHQLGPKKQWKEVDTIIISEPGNGEEGVVTESA